MTVVEGEVVKNREEAAPAVSDTDYMPAEEEVLAVQAKAEAAQSGGVVVQAALAILDLETIRQFRGRAMVMERRPYPHFVPLHKDRFDKLAYPVLGGQTRSRMGDVYAYLSNTVEDLTEYEDLILFGIPPSLMEVEADTDIAHAFTHKPLVWDMRSLEWVLGEEVGRCVWRSPHPPVNPRKEAEPIPFIMSLAGGDQGVYDDIMQSIAPMVMSKKPDGVIWWIGDGANGKSTLMDAIYRIFPGQLASLTVKSLTDGRDTVHLNGHLANIVKESSEGRVDDTEIYKAVGTHEDFRTHKFHSQDTVLIRGNMHHIFSANSIPTFNDKGFSARRRTFIVPFNQVFKSDPSFEEKTFTPLMFGQLVAEMCRYAQRLRNQGYRYKWSAITLAAKADYDTAANNAEEYAKQLIDGGVVAFDNFNVIRMDYETYCADNGYVPLGIGNLRRAVLSFGFDRMSQQVPGSDKQMHITKMYKLPNTTNAGLPQPVGMGRPGLYTLPGFMPDPPKPPVPHFQEPQTDDEAEAPEPEPVKKTILNGRW